MPIALSSLPVDARHGARSQLWYVRSDGAGHAGAAKAARGLPPGRRGSVRSQLQIGKPKAEQITLHAAASALAVMGGGRAKRSKP